MNTKASLRNSSKRICIKVSGRVQGVAFRAHACREAQKLGLTGWVKNLPDGRVEAVAEGTPETLEKFKTWCQMGPPAAHVISIQAHIEPDTGEFDSFTISY